MMRVFRVLRLVVFVERLNVLVSAFILALRSVLWVLLLLFLIIYMFAVVATDVFWKENEDMRRNLPTVFVWFGSVPRSMATLVQVATYDNWADIAREMQHETVFVWFFFILWIAVAAVGLLNLLTAVFIEALVEVSGQAEDRQEKEAHEKRSKIIESLGRLFDFYDDDRSGDLDEEEKNELMVLFDNEDFTQHLKANNISIHHAKEAIRYADRDGDGRIDQREFLDALKTMDEASAKRDTWELAHKVRELDTEMTANHKLRSTKMLQMTQSVETEMTAFAEAIGKLNVVGRMGVAT